MKIRMGFVSNSSSSSFVCWGVVLDRLPDNVEDALHKEKLAINRGLGDYYDEYVVGLSPANMVEDETLRQFKKRVLERLQTAMPDKNYTYDDIELHVDGGRDD